MNMTDIAPGIVIDPKKRFGKPIVKGTRQTDQEEMGALAGGKAPEEVMKEYGLGKEQILAVLQYAAMFLNEETVDTLETV